MTFMNISDSEYYISILAHTYDEHVVHFGIHNGTTFYETLCKNKNVNWSPTLKEGSPGTLHNVDKIQCHMCGDLIYLSGTVQITIGSTEYLKIPLPIKEGAIPLYGQVYYNPEQGYIAFQQGEELMFHPVNGSSIIQTWCTFSVIYIINAKQY